MNTFDEHFQLSLLLIVDCYEALTRFVVSCHLLQEYQHDYLRYGIIRQ